MKYDGLEPLFKKESKYIRTNFLKTEKCPFKPRAT